MEGVATVHAQIHCHPDTKSKVHPKKKYTSTGHTIAAGPALSLFFCMSRAPCEHYRSTFDFYLWPLSAVICRHKRTLVLQIQAVLFVLNSFKPCKNVKTALSVLLFARYTLKALKILETLRWVWHPWICLTTTPRHPANFLTWDDGFNVFWVHYTVCFCEVKACSCTPLSKLCGVRVYSTAVYNKTLNCIRSPCSRL